MQRVFFALGRHVRWDRPEIWDSQYRMVEADSIEMRRKICADRLNKFFAFLLAVSLSSHISSCGGEDGSFGGQETVLKLPRMSFPVRIYEVDKHCRALVLFASGDGGWKAFEDKICRYLASQAVCVIGWDCRKFADPGLYDQKVLAAGFAAALEEARRITGVRDAPVVFSGYSTGAEQAVAAASASPRQPNLVGLLIIAPAERGRYGITTSDLMGIKPVGKGSFALSDLAQGVEGLRVVQIHGEYDPLDSTEWLGHLDTPHQLKIYPGGWHFFKDGPPDFLKLLADAIDWILSPAGKS
jgi:phosphatidylglycerol lysyltransferase